MEELGNISTRWVPHVAQFVIRNRMADFVCLGRMMLSHPDMSADILAGKELDRKRIRRIFSDCTDVPRNGLVSGCYPLDPIYKSHHDYFCLKQIKQKTKE